LRRRTLDPKARFKLNTQIFAYFILGVLSAGRVLLPARAARAEFNSFCYKYISGRGKLPFTSAAGTGEKRERERERERERTRGRRKNACTQKNLARWNNGGDRFFGKIE